MAYTFFVITVPDANDPRAWAERMWEIYGFEYDTERFGTETVVAWALDSDDELKEALSYDGIHYTTFQVEDLDEFFGLKDAC